MYSLWVCCLRGCCCIVTGCADISAPDHAWLERRGDTVQVACNHTSERWHLVCKGVDWIGAFGNCTGDRVSGRVGHGVDSSSVHVGNIIIAIFLYQPTLVTMITVTMNE